MPHAEGLDPLRDVRNVDFDLMLSDLGQIEKRLERLEKDLKRMHAPELEQEQELLQHCKAQLESEHPLRELELTPAVQATHGATWTQVERAVRAGGARLTRDPAAVRDSLQALGDAARRANLEPEACAAGRTGNCRRGWLGSALGGDASCQSRRN